MSHLISVIAAWKQSWQKHIVIFLVDGLLIELYLHDPNSVLLLPRTLTGSQLNFFKTLLIYSHFGTKFTIVNSQLIIYTDNYCIVPCITCKARYWLFYWHANIWHSVIIPCSLRCLKIQFSNGQRKSNNGQIWGQLWPDFLSVYLICPSSPPEIHRSASGCHLIEVTSDKWPFITVRYLNGFDDIIALITLSLVRIADVIIT